MSSVVGETHLEKHMSRLKCFREGENNSKRFGKHFIGKIKLKSGYELRSLIGAKQVIHVTQTAQV